MVVRNNVINMVSGREVGNAALFIAPDLGPSSPGPVTITGNWLDGGNYTLFCVDGNNGQYFVDNITITDNRFGSGGVVRPREGQRAGHRERQRDGPVGGTCALLRRM